MPAHEISIFSLSEVTKIAAMDLKEFHEMFGSRSANAALRFRRELQKALRDYAKEMHTFDWVQSQLLEKCQIIERWCRNRFYKEHLPKYQSQNSPYISAKARVRQEWETFVTRHGY